MKKRGKSYEESLLEDLKDPREAAAYLNAHLEDDGEDAEDLFLLALRDVARANGFSDVAERADVGRESLYKSLSEEGNPKVRTLRRVLRAVGLKISVDVNAA